MKITKISIINPDTAKPVSVVDWKKESNPTRAEWVLIETDELKPFCLNKKLGKNGRHISYKTARSFNNRLTRAQGLALYEAKSQGLLQAMKLIGGDNLEECAWLWTCEQNKIREEKRVYNTLVCLMYGAIDNALKTSRHQMCVVSSFEI